MSGRSVGRGAGSWQWMCAGSASPAPHSAPVGRRLAPQPAVADPHLQHAAPRPGARDRGRKWPPITGRRGAAAGRPRRRQAMLPTASHSPHPPNPQQAATVSSASTARRDALLSYQAAAQARWAADKLFEADAPAKGGEREGEREEEDRVEAASSCAPTDPPQPSSL